MPEKIDTKYALNTIDMDKYFGNVCALNKVNFSVGTNETVGLIGDNGAGKSTLIKIITGVFPPSNGQVFFKDKLINFSNYTVKKAHAMGIETVYQDKSLGELQALWRNFFVGRQITNSLGFIKVKKEKKIANDIMKNMIGFRGVGITVDSRARQLSGGERQGISIGRAMYFDASIIVLDEPTAALSLKEVRKVLNFVHKLKENGKACIYVSHDIQDVYEISDRFVVLDRGQIVASIPKTDITLKQLNEFLLDYAHGKKE